MIAVKMGCYTFGGKEQIWEEICAVCNQESFSTMFNRYIEHS